MKYVRQSPQKIKETNEALGEPSGPCARCAGKNPADPLRAFGCQPRRYGKCGYSLKYSLPHGEYVCEPAGVGIRGLQPMSAVRDNAYFKYQDLVPLGRLPNGLYFPNETLNQARYSKRQWVSDLLFLRKMTANCGSRLVFKFNAHLVVRESAGAAIRRNEMGITAT